MFECWKKTISWRAVGTSLLVGLNSASSCVNFKSLNENQFIHGVCVCVFVSARVLIDLDKSKLLEGTMRLN